MSAIKVEIKSQDPPTISIYNNGQGIPVEIHETEKVYIPELIFGHLLTSSNYDDAEQKVTGGRNGFGAKLCNIFSNRFIVETSDKVRGKRFRQVFTENMSNAEKPKLLKATKEDFTQVTFEPDLSKFGLTHLSEDFVALMRKRVVDLAGCVRDVKVFLDGERIKVKNFKDYCGLYLGYGAPTKPQPAESEAPQANDGEDGSSLSTEDAPPPLVLEEPQKPKPPMIYERINDRWEVCFTPSEDGQFHQVSFVNSICTSRGGTHVTYVSEQIVSYLIKLGSKKAKQAAIKPHQARSQLWVFVNCLIVNPAFDSQTKDTLTLRASFFGSKCILPDTYLAKVGKTGVLEEMMMQVKFKEDQALKKTDGGKRSRVTGITKLEDANLAGTRRSRECTLILTEGDSAKALAISGLGKVGRDRYGVFPLRGKLLNVRDASHKQIMDNAEINAIKKILGLQHGKVYDGVESLRYGHLMIMTDQDHDGSHIKGLIINFVDHFWPGLLKVKGFLQEFITPIVKVENSRKEQKSFFTLPEYEKWRDELDANNTSRGGGSSKWKHSYLKVRLYGGEQASLSALSHDLLPFFSPPYLIYPYPHTLFFSFFFSTHTHTRTFTGFGILYE